MNTLLMTVAGALLGGGLLLIVRGALGSTVPLASLVAELHRPRHSSIQVRPRTDELIERLAGRPTPARDADLAVCERAVAKFVQDQLLVLRRVSYSSCSAWPGLDRCFLRLPWCCLPSVELLADGSMHGSISAPMQKRLDGSSVTRWPATSNLSPS